MDQNSSTRGNHTFAHSKSDVHAHAPDTSSSSTSVAAAAPEPSTLAVKLSEDPESQVRPEDHEGCENQHSLEGQHSSLKEGDQESRGHSPVIRRSRSGRMLRSTVQYDERSSDESSPDNSAEAQGPYVRRMRSSYQSQDSPSEGDDQADASKRTSRREAEDRLEEQYGDENQDELASEDEREDDGFGEEGDDVNNEGSRSVDTNSSKNDDGSESLNISMYGSPSLVKVRSMFIDKLYKMVEDPSIQHLISWAKEGDMFYVYNCIELSSSVLPKFFKHNNWQSFVRQLNMYGFHKIYRYDREESTMNRRNPETQRWQFYHPDFQRDRPHLRNNIKRKSARSGNIAPTFSRVVFERDKGGFYMQQESPVRPFNDQGGHSRSHSSNHPQDQRVFGHIHGGPPPAPHHYSPHPASMHRSPHDPSRPLASRSISDYRSPIGHYPSDQLHPRDDKDLTPSRHHAPPAIHQQPRREHEQHYPQHQNYSTPPYQQQPGYGSPHQRQHSYAGPSSQAHYSPEQGYSHKAQGFNPAQPPSQDPPPSHALGPGRPSNQEHGHSSSREPGYMEYGLDIKHGVLMSGGHFRSQSAPGLDPRRDVARGPHPFSQQELPHSPSPQGSQSYFQREPYPTRAHSHRHQGSFDENTVKVLPGSEMGLVAGEGPSPSHRGSLPKHPLSPMDHNRLHPGAAGSLSNVPQPHSEQHRRSVPGGDLEDPSRRLSSPPPPPPPGTIPQHHGQKRHSGQPPSPPPHQVSDSVLPAESHPGMDPNANPSPHDLVPRTLKHLENRLHSVEDAYMSLRQFAKELQGVQAAQDQTIAWMRDRIDQLSEATTPRDVIMSPPLGQAGVVPSKRKVEHSFGDPRDWSRRGLPPEHHQHQQQVYPRQGATFSAPHPPTSQGLSPGGLGGTRYESGGYHPSFNAAHHHPPQSAPPHTSPSQQQQQQQQQQRQHPSPSMNASNPHYQNAPLASILHD